MENQIKVKDELIEPERLYTKMEYHKHTGINRVKIDEMIKYKELKVVEINGATLIISK